jgi:predicted nuclease of predicted toxin-antitoxin system
MGTLASELGSRVEQLSRQPRVYVDANIPAGAVSHMRERLRWDVVAVVEDDELRRASDVDHYQTARRLRRTLITLDDDFLEERLFPWEESPGVIVVSAPNEAGLVKLLDKIHRAFFAARGRRDRRRRALPLEGQMLQVHPDWDVPSGKTAARRRRRRRTRRAVSSGTTSA